MWKWTSLKTEGGLFHRHDWRIIKRHIATQFEKQEGQGVESVVLCIGRLEGCTCFTRRIVPIYPKNYKIVEVLI